MRVVLQRVSEAAVHIDGATHAAIGPGLLLLLGVQDGDGAEDIEWLCGKISRLRVFNDEAGLMNRSVADIRGQILVISQFTLFASTKKGNRPSFSSAARPEVAIPLYEAFLAQLTKESGLTIRAGVFGADMKVHLVNDGPVTIWIDSKARE